MIRDPYSENDGFYIDMGFTQKRPINPNLHGKGDLFFYLRLK